MGEQKTEDLLVTFEIVHDKQQVLMSYPSGSNSYLENLAIEQIKKHLDAYPGYEIFSKLEPEDENKIKNLSRMGFSDFISVVTVTRPITELDFVEPPMPDGLSWRFLDMENELELWYNLTVSGYSGAPEFRGFSFESWKKLVVDDNGNFLPDSVENGVAVLQLDSKPIGIIGLGKQDVESKRGWFVTFGVNPDYRGRGYGELLMKLLWFLEFSRGSSVSAISVNEKNLAAFTLYKKLGYDVEKQTQIIMKYVGD